MGKRKKLTEYKGDYLSRDFDEANAASSYPYKSVAGTDFKTACAQNKSEWYKPAPAPARCTAKHDGRPLILHAGNKVVGGASQLYLNQSGVNLVVDCCGLVKAPGPFVGSQEPRWQSLKKFEPIPPPVLRLNWPDMSAPDMPLAFWVELWTLLPEGKTVFCCQAGHGGTGTALAAMMIALGCGAEKATDHIRKEHCDFAIESMEQEDYLLELELQR